MTTLETRQFETKPAKRKLDFGFGAEPGERAEHNDHNDHNDHSNHAVHARAATRSANTAGSAIEVVPGTPTDLGGVDIPEAKRRAQNRAAQRAFRERKEKHLKDLEARLAELESERGSWKSTNMALRNKLSLLENELQQYRWPELKALSPGSAPGLSSESVSSSETPIGADGFCARMSSACVVDQKKIAKDAPYISADYPGWQNDDLFGRKNSIEFWLRGREQSIPDAQLSHTSTPQPQSTPQVQNPLGNPLGNPLDQPLGHPMGQQTPQQQPPTSRQTTPQQPLNPQPVGQQPVGQQPLVQPSIEQLPFGQQTNAQPNAQSGSDPLAFVFSESDPLNLDFGTMATGFGGFSLDDKGDFSGLLNNDLGVFDPLDGLLEWNPKEESAQTPAGQGTSGSPLFSPGENEKLIQSPLVGAYDNGSAPAPRDEQVPSASQRFIQCGDVWDRICSHPRFGEIDINSMCQELRNKARCSKTGVVLDEDDVNAVLKSMR